MNEMWKLRADGLNPTVANLALVAEFRDAILDGGLEVYLLKPEADKAAQVPNALVAIGAGELAYWLYMSFIDAFGCVPDTDVTKREEQVSIIGASDTLVEFDVIFSARVEKIDRLLAQHRARASSRRAP